MRFKKFNNNPSKKKKGDCVVRAISHALDKPWLEVYDDLCKIGRELHDMPNMKDTYSKYLEMQGFRKVTPKVVKGKKRLTAQKMGKGTYILSLANHLSVAKEGTLYDLWDCRTKCVYSYWVVKEEAK